MASNKFDQAMEAYKMGDYQECFILLDELVDKEDAEALCEMGFFYYEGDHHMNIPQNEDMAIEYFQRAAAQHCQKAEFQLGYIERQKENGQTALEWYKRAFSQEGEFKGVALNNTAVLYLGGKAGVEQNIPLALECYQKAAEENYAIAAQNLGYIYWNGEYVDKDAALSKRYFEMAAELGSADAREALAEYFSESTPPSSTASKGGSIIGGILCALGGAYVAAGICLLLMMDSLFDVLGATIAVAVIIALIIGAILGAKKSYGSAFKTTVVCVAIACLIMSGIGSCSDSSGSNAYNDKGLTQQEKDNLEFYYEMNDAWEEFRNDYNN